MTSTPERPSLGSYVLCEKLGESLRALVYKGYHKHVPDQPLIIKCLKLLSKWEDQSRHLQLKVERLKVLHDPRVSIPLSLESYDNQHFIVQPWFDGQPLNQWGSQQPAITLDSFFTLACSLADTLHSVHEAGITHGGVKPHNILIQASNLSLRLTDFITPLDIRDVSHFIYDPEFVRNTLAYTSPEQTGRINYRVDCTTDLYSFGVVLYELLTHRLPFFSSDPLELIHSHLAEEAHPVHTLNAEIPIMLGKIIAKLMQKQPEKRYQSASGVLADLQTCQRQYLNTGHIEHFPPGQHDLSRRVIFISKMVGRRHESRSIMHEYQTVMTGCFRSLFISGLSGIGKTRLIQELQKPLVQHRGYFTAGKFDQYQKNQPYSSLIQALRNLMRTFLTESDDRLMQWRQKILSAVENNGGVLVDVVPELSYIIGPQPAPLPLPPVEARNRFNNLFGRFLATLASEDNPLVLFIDDLQWCDSATFDFLQNLFANHQEHPYLFLIGAYRHNEVDSAHPLSKLIHQVQEIDGPLTEMRLKALPKADCHEMVAYILDASLQTTAHLADFITHLTEGNPLFVSESLAWLHNEGLLTTDAQHHWIWDIQRIRETQMPATVVELFSAKVHKLPSHTLFILDHCACMGNRFTAEDVALVVGKRIEPLFEDLKPVLNLGLLIENKADLQFVHDRVQEAVLRRIDQQTRTAIHWRIGNCLLSSAASSSLQELDNLFAIATHLNRGCPPILEHEQAYWLVDINFQAGCKALDALAGEAANEFFAKAHDYLPDDCWEEAYDLSFRIYRHLAKTELMCGRYARSEALLNHLIEHAISDLDKAEALAEQTTSLSSFGNFSEAIATANRGLAYFDKAIPLDGDTAKQRLADLMQRIAAHGDVWDTILHMPFTDERRRKIELAFYAELIPDLYMCGWVPQLYLSAAQSTLHCLQGGMDESVIYSFSIMGLNLGEQGHFEQAFRYQDLAHDLCAKYPNTFGATRGMNGIVWCNMHSRSHPADIVAYALKAIQSGKNCGDLYNAGLSYGPLMWNQIIQGRNLREVEDSAEECLQFSRKNQLSFSVGLAQAVMAGWTIPMKTGAASLDMHDTLKDWEHSHYVAASGSYFALLGFSQYFLGDHAAAADSLAQVEGHLHGLTDNVLKRLWYVFRILNRLRQTDAQRPDELEVEIELLLAQLEVWAALGPLLQPYLCFIHAEHARHRGEYREARTLYLDAIIVAQKQHYDLLCGHIYESLADLLYQHDLGDAALYYGEARRYYRLCRAEAKNRILEDCHITPNPQNGVRARRENQPSSTLPNLDINYLMKSALALSAEIDLAQLMQKIMAVVLESSAAQHGYLIVKQHDELVIAAERHIGKQHIDHPPLQILTEAKDVCRAIVNYVMRTHEKVVLDNAFQEGDFQHAPEVQALELRSVLCLPILKQSELIGVLYLENRLSEKVFTREKIIMTELLTAQAAISLENARLLEETRQAYQQLRKNQEHMLQIEKLSALGTLVGGVAHEINNPLMGVMNFVEFVADRMEAGEAKNILHQALQHIQRIKKIVTNMLVFLHNTPTPDGHCAVITIASQSLALLKAELVKARIGIEVDIPEDLPPIACSAETLQQILVNLIVNARDALKGSDNGRIEIRACTTHDLVELTITDNGPGISEDVQSRMFDPFFTTKPPGQGTGLGLSVTRRLVQDLGGSITVESYLGGGCCMRLKFPLFAGQAGAVACVIPTSQPPMEPRPK